MSEIPPPPPPGTNYILAIQPAVAFLMIGTTFGAFLVPILIALVAFSTPHLRRRPAFYLNVLAVISGLVLCFMNGFSEVHSMLSPLSPLSTDYFLAYGLFTTITPILVDSILLLRLFAVFPYERTPARIWFSVMAFPIIVKLARIINISIGAHLEDTIVHGSNGAALSANAVLTEFPNTKIEWFCQLFDNVYSSTVFIYKLHQHNSQTAGARRVDSRQSFGAAITALFWIAVSNFIFPVILSLTQIIVFMGTSNVLLALYIQEVNFYVTIIGVVFATVWSTGVAWADAKSFTPSSVMSAFEAPKKHDLRGMGGNGSGFRAVRARQQASTFGTNTTGTTIDVSASRKESEHDLHDSLREDSIPLSAVRGKDDFPPTPI